MALSLDDWIEEDYLHQEEVSMEDQVEDEVPLVEQGDGHHINSSPLAFSPPLVKEQGTSLQAFIEGNHFEYQWLKLTAL